MSNSKSLHEFQVRMPDLAEIEYDSAPDSGNYEEMFDENTSNGKEYATHYYAYSLYPNISPYSTEDQSPHPHNPYKTVSDLGIASRTESLYPSISSCIADKNQDTSISRLSSISSDFEEISKNDCVIDLLQSHIVENELNSHESDSLKSRSNSKFYSQHDKNGHFEINAPSASQFYLSEDGKKSVCNYSTFPCGQLLSNFPDNLLSTASSTTDADTANVKSFVLKKQNPTPSSANDSSQQTQMKTKLKTMWNNVKYGWRVKKEVNLKLDSATWILGQYYHNKSNDGPATQDNIRRLKLDILSKIWLTYRINFPTIPGTDIISDSGWGCMVRCGQMMMAQGLVCHFLHRGWRISPEQPPDIERLHKKILRWFGDSVSENSPFSLHHLVSLGENYGRKAGDWYGPTHAAQILRDALIQAKRDHVELRNVSMYVALDGIVFKQDIMDLCSLPNQKNVALPNPSIVQFKPHTLYPSLSEFLPCENKRNWNKNQDIAGVEQSVNFECLEDNNEFNCTEVGSSSFNSANEQWTSLLLFVSVRLGNDKINPFYIPCLKSILAYDHCIGIIGGRPKHALYFIGWQEDKLIHMDPHSCQPAVDVELEDFNKKSFHSSSIRTISFSEMDPSCAIGFYFRKREEFQDFVDRFTEITSPLKRNLDYPIFALAEGRRSDIEETDMPHVYTKSFIQNNHIDDDDYILL